MQRAFIVKLDIDSTLSVDGIAADIAELVGDDYNVLEVKPWASSTLMQLEPTTEPRNDGPNISQLG